MCCDSHCCPIGSQCVAMSNQAIPNVLSCCVELVIRRFPVKVERRKVASRCVVVVGSNQTIPNVQTLERSGDDLDAPSSQRGHANSQEALVARPSTYCVGSRGRLSG